MVSDSEDSDEEWFFNSIKRYEDLLIYEFQGSISCCWFHKDDTLLVACQRSTRFELLELAIADRLLISKDESIIKNRDFKVLSAGYTINDVSVIRSSDDFAITSESDSVNMYKFGNANSDLITFNSSVRQGISHPLISFHRQDIDVMSGTHLSNIQCYNLSTEKVSAYLLKSNDSDKPQDCRISYLGTHSNSIYCGFHEMGQLVSYDSRSREPSIIAKFDEDTTSHWFYDVSKSGTKFALCNYLGNLTVFDIRNISKVYFKSSIEFSSDCINYRKAKVNFDTFENFLSISGFNRSVFVYSMNSSDDNNLKFVHDGHKKKAKYLSDHFWHPTIKNTVFSMDDVGVLQAWKFV